MAGQARIGFRSQDSKPGHGIDLVFQRVCFIHGRGK